MAFGTMQSKFSSFFPLNHDNVIAKFSFDRWICVHWTGYSRNWQSERCILEWPNHCSTNLPTQISALSCFIFTISSRYVRKLLSGLQFFQSLQDFALFFAQNMTHFDRIASFFLFASCSTYKFSRSSHDYLLLIVGFINCR